MSGAWELRQQQSVLVAILHTEQVSLAWSFGLRNLIIPGPPPLPIAGMPFDHARNTACHVALQNGLEWLFFLDSDVIPPRDAILRLRSHQKPLISGVYHRRSPPHGLPVMQRPPGNWVREYPPHALIEVDVVGAGCLLIHRSVLERLPPQRPEAGKGWFDWRVDCGGIPNYNKSCMSEDFTFCLHCKQHLGIPTLVDTSVQCRHIGASQATYGKMEPLECAAVT